MKGDDRRIMMAFSAMVCARPLPSNMLVLCSTFMA
jgi:hypothetical protein